MIRYRLALSLALICINLTYGHSLQAESLSPQELAERLRAIEAEIASEKAAIAALKSVHEKSQASSLAKREEIAGQIIRTQRLLTQESGEIKQLEQDLKTARDTAKELAQSVGTIKPQEAAHEERLGILLSDIPEPVRKDITSMTEAYRRSQSVTAINTAFFAADGNKAQGQIIAIGLSRFAYLIHNREGGQAGLALASPTSASGYRWSEQLTPDATSAITKLARLLASKNKHQGLAIMPLDPTGSLTPQTSRNHSLMDKLAAGGPVMYPLGAIALLALLLILERFYLLHLRSSSSDRMAHQVIAHLSGGEFESAQTLCINRGGVIARVLHSCIERRDGGKHAMEDAVQAQLLHEQPRLNRYMGAIAILAAVAPLLGLLGTVTGIIETFGIIKSFGNANPSLMAGGISEALVTTATGLTIAVPILIMHSFLRGRSDRLLASSEKYAATALTILSHGDKKSGASHD